METTFTPSDWRVVRENAATVTAQLRAKGASVDDFSPLPPVPLSQIDEFIDETGVKLPGDFIDLITKFAGGWRFWWCLNVRAKDGWLKPPIFMGNFGGNSEVPFIGVTPGETLLDHYQSFQAEISRTYLNDPETLRILPSLFPLHSFDGGGGDYTVLRLDASPARIYYMDHELGWPIDDEHLIGISFREFVLGWSNLGFPGCEYHECWVNSQTRQPDNKSPNAYGWWKWLEDSSAS